MGVGGGCGDFSGPKESQIVRSGKMHGGVVVLKKGDGGDTHPIQTMLCCPHG